MEMFQRFAQQYQEACISYAQLKQLWEETFQAVGTIDRVGKLLEYRRAMEALEQQLGLLEEHYRIHLLDRLRGSLGAAPTA